MEEEAGGRRKTRTPHPNNDVGKSFRKPVKNHLYLAEKPTQSFPTSQPSRLHALRATQQAYYLSQTMVER